LLKAKSEYKNPLLVPKEDLFGPLYRIDICDLIL
jgi:hypothetical protein